MMTYGEMENCVKRQGFAVTTQNNNDFTIIYLFDKEEFEKVTILMKTFFGFSKNVVVYVKTLNIYIMRDHFTISHLLLA